MKTMLYKPDGKEVIWGIKCTTCVVDSDDAEELLAQGWHKTPLDFGHEPDLDEPDLDEPDLDHKPDTNELSYDDAKVYAKDNEIDIEGLHWTKVVAVVKEYINGDSND